MPELHEHLPGPDHVRVITYVSEDGKPMRATPEEGPPSLCILPDCHLDRPADGSRSADAAASGAPGHDGDKLSTSAPEGSKDNMASSKPKRIIPKGSMVYNEWGELVDPAELRADPASKDMDARAMFRLILLNWHYRFKRKLNDILAAQLEGDSPFDDGPLTLSGRLMSWELKTASKQSGAEMPGATFKVAVYDGPTRILDIGCDAGGWCFAVKKQHPDWIVEGIDDINRWAEMHGSAYIDFMDGNAAETKHFGRIHLTQKTPEFTLRSYDALLIHEKPIPRNLYGLVHGRDIFGRVENCKTFLDDIRQILQPDGVVEFSEIDPRPRTFNSGGNHDDPTDHTSRAVTGFSSVIADRFKSPLDAELATDVPKWISRVDARLKAALRPHDGIAAANLKGWVEGAGFWDVKEVIVQLVVGGDTHRGALMLGFINFQVEVENTVPKIAKELPEPEKEAVESGKYFLNLHIVTGRKPLQPRPGDLLLDGTRQGMADPYADMSRYPLTKATHWERFAKFDIGGSLATNKLSKFKVPGPNLRDRISSLRLHGLSLDSHDLDDGHMMGSGSGLSIASGSGTTHPPPPYQAAGRGFGLGTGPEIPWATRPDMNEYYAAKAAAAAAQSTTSGDIPTGATTRQAVTSPANTTSTTSTVDKVVTTQVATGETSAAECITDTATTREISDTGIAHAEVTSTAAITEPIIIEGTFTEVAHIGGAHTEALITETDHAEVAHIEDVTADVARTEIVTTIGTLKDEAATATVTEVEPEVDDETRSSETDTVQELLSAAATGEIGTAQAVTEDLATATE